LEVFIAIARRELPRDRSGAGVEIYFEGGDHQTLIHVTGAEFARVTSGTLNGWFSRL
jgi:hypothetical protein